MIYFFFLYPKTNFIGQRIIFSLPAVKRLVQEVELARMGYLLGTLLGAGLPVVPAVRSLSEASSFYMYKKFYDFLASRIEEGNSFEKAFNLYLQADKLIPVPIVQLVVAGERSGELAKSLLEIGRIFEEKVETTSKNLSNLLEPVLLIFVWIGVAAVALAIMLPIYNLVGSIDQPSSIESPAPVVSPVITTPPTSTLEIQGVGSEPAVLEGAVKKLRILPTELGYLNVREEPSLEAKIITKVMPDAVYEYNDKKERWYRIVIPGEAAAEPPLRGWVFDKYVVPYE